MDLHDLIISVADGFRPISYYTGLAWLHLLVLDSNAGLDSPNII